MRVGKQRIIRGIGLVLVVMLALGVGLSTVFAQGAPTRVSGGGEAIAGTVTYPTTLPVPTFPFFPITSGTGAVGDAVNDSTGHRITFGFNAKKMKDGSVQGQMEIIDHTRGLSVSSDVAVLVVPLPVLLAPLPFSGPTALMESSTNQTIVDGVLQPGWKLRNVPLFDGGEGSGSADTVCFELFDASGVKLYQWSAFLSSGNVQIVP